MVLPDGHFDGETRSPVLHYNYYPMFRILPVLLFSWLSVLGFSQTPQLHLKFDGDLSDASTAGIITSVVPNAAWTPAYTTDRFGVANKAIAFTGSQSLQLRSALANNSNQALGLRNPGGPVASFTLSAWVKLSSLLSWYNTIFGNIGTGTGTLHAGFYINTGKTKLLDPIETNSSFDSGVVGVWFHVVFVYDAATGSQRVYLNGIPDSARVTANTIKAADLFLGNHGGTGTDSNNDFRGSLDDVIVYNTALSHAKIQALYNGADPANLPANYSAPRLPGVIGTTGLWGVREIKAYPGATYPYGTLVLADRIINAYASAPAGTVAQYTTSVINLVDPQAPGNLGTFGSEANFGTNTSSPDDNFLVVAKGTVRIAVEDDYTFGFAGDEGSRLRIVGQTFVSSSGVNGSG